MFEETLRLYSAGALQRETPKGGLDLLGYHVPEGTWIMVRLSHCNANQCIYIMADNMYCLFYTCSLCPTLCYGVLSIMTTPSNLIQVALILDRNGDYFLLLTYLCYPPHLITVLVLTSTFHLVLDTVLV